MFHSCLPQLPSPEITPEEERRLYTEAKAGDSGARDQITMVAVAQAMMVLDGLIRGRAQRRLFDRDERESIAQIAAVFSVRAWTPDDGRLKAFVVNWTKYHLRMSGRQSVRATLQSDLSAEELGELAEMAAPEAAAAVQDRDDIQSPALRAAFAALPPRHQEVIRLRYFENCVTGQIADRLYLTPRRIRQLHAEALQRLRNSLTAGGDADCSPGDAA